VQMERKLNELGETLVKASSDFHEKAVKVNFVGT